LLAYLIMQLAQAFISSAVHIPRPHRKFVEHAPATAEIDPNLLRLEPKPVPRAYLLARVGELMAVPAGEKTTRTAVDLNNAFAAATGEPRPFAAKSASRPIDVDPLGRLAGPEPPHFEFLAINVDHSYCRHFSIASPNPTYALRLPKIAASGKFQHTDEGR
jgi:hypothetical protein